MKAGNRRVRLPDLFLCGLAAAAFNASGAEWTGVQLRPDVDATTQHCAPRNEADMPPANKAEPAVLADPGPAARASLQRTIEALLQAEVAELADTALRGSSFLLIERKRPRDATGMLLSGRDFERAEVFQLFKRDDLCYLRRLTTGAIRAMPQLHCRALP